MIPFRYHLLLCYKSPDSGCAEGELARPGAQTLDGLTDMSMESDSSECECSCDCESTKCEAIDFYRISTDSGCAEGELARPGAQTLDGLTDMSMESDSSECECYNCLL